MSNFKLHRDKNFKAMPFPMDLLYNPDISWGAKGYYVYLFQNPFTEPRECFFDENSEEILGYIEELKKYDYVEIIEE